MAKLAGFANTLEDRMKMKNLDKMENWAANYRMKFKDKYNILYIDKKKQRITGGLTTKYNRLWCMKNSTFTL